MGSKAYTPYDRYLYDRNPDASPFAELGPARGSRGDVAARLEYMQRTGAAFLAANGYVAGTPLHTAHQEFIKAADAWRSGTPGFEADRALEVARRDFERAVRAEYKALGGLGRAQDGTPVPRPPVSTELGNLIQDLGDSGKRLEHYVRDTHLDRPTVGSYPGAFWREHAPEIYPPQTDRPTGWREGGLPIPEGLPRFTFADAGPAPLANLGRPADRVAPDPEAERIRTTG